MQGFWENAVMPVCSAIMMIWFAPDKVNNPAKPHAYANGAFILVRREAYEKIGTHEAVKSEVNEDMHMAWRIKKQGMTVRVIRNKDLCRVRMYTSLGEMLRGWSRIYYGTFGTVRRVVVSLAVLLLVSLLPYLMMIASLIAIPASTQPSPLLAVLGLTALAAVVMQLSVIHRFYGMVGVRQDMFWSYPIGCAIGLEALVMALGKMRKGAKIAWRNTTYAAGEKS
jgi:cellulose synthase/poly-beta-1,6-N-acetylglucosamine synthase-like glycosyltransferase